MIKNTSGMDFMFAPFSGVMLNMLHPLVPPPLFTNRLTFMRHRMGFALVGAPIVPGAAEVAHRATGLHYTADGRQDIFLYMYIHTFAKTDIQIYIYI